MEKKEEVAGYLKGIVLVACAYWCVWSWKHIIGLHGDINVYYGGMYFGYNLWSIILFALDIFLINRWYKLENRRLKIFSVFGGMLMSILIVYGAYAHFVNDIFLSVGETFAQFGYMIGFGFVVVPLWAELFMLIEKGVVWYQSSIQNAKKLHPKRFFLLTWAGIFLCYLPVFLGYWPGNFIFDARYQLANVVEDIHYTHHPLIHTLMMGAAYNFGLKIGNVSVGFQFYVLAQMLILSAAFAYFLLYLYKQRAPKCIQVGCFLWFSLFPMHTIFSITTTKDVLCAAFFLFFMVFVARLFVNRETVKWYSYVGMVVCGVFLCLFRNNAMYAVMVAGIIIAVMTKGIRKKGLILGGIVVIYLFTSISDEVLIRSVNARTEDKYRESLSLPLQGMARVASYRGDALSQELYAELITYIREEDIAYYNPYLSDPIKNQANEEKLATNLLNFFKLWGKIGLQFPDEYLESVITNTVGYWYPLNQGTYVSNDLAVYHTLIGIGQEIEKKSYCNWILDIYDPLFYEKKFYSVPILGFFFRNAFYIWTILVYVLWCFYKKKWSMLKLGLLPLLYFATCILGPWAALRYIYCLVVTTPLLLQTMLGDKKE